MLVRIKEAITDSIMLKQSVLADEKLLEKIEQIIGVCIIALKSDKKILFCGNGGSAADAQHLAAEFTGRFYKDREPFNAEALHVNTSYLTSVANDYGYDEVYARIVKAKARRGDVLFGLSTSGNSMNVIKAMEQARSQNVITIAMTGLSGGKIALASDFLINVSSSDTPRIQEAHMMLGHIICEMVEKKMGELV